MPDFYATGYTFNSEAGTTLPGFLWHPVYPVCTETFSDRMKAEYRTKLLNLATLCSRSTHFSTQTLNGIQMVKDAR